MTDIRENLADIIESAMDNVHDIDVTHRDYAAYAAEKLLEEYEINLKGTNV